MTRTADDPQPNRPVELRPGGAPAVLLLLAATVGAVVMPLLYAMSAPEASSSGAWTVLVALGGALLAAGLAAGYERSVIGRFPERVDDERWQQGRHKHLAGEDTRL